jgi:hypothetical protein
MAARNQHLLAGCSVGSWEAAGQSDEWMTPRYIFDALGERFDLDVAAPIEGPRHAFAYNWYHAIDNGLRRPWYGFVWANPPYGGRNSLGVWVDRLADHGSGICLVPDRTSAPWFQPAAMRADAILFTSDKIKFERPDGSLGKSPGNGSCLMAFGRRAEFALLRAAPALGMVCKPMGTIINRNWRTI